MLKSILIAICLVIPSLASAKQDAIITFDENDNLYSIDHVSDEWFKINEFDNKEFWIRNKNIEIAKLGDDKDLRRVFGMIRIIDGDKKVPGIGEGVRRIYSEAVVNCVDGAIVPVRDFYTDDLGLIIKGYRHKPGKGVMIGVQETGTMGYAVYSISCLGILPEVK